MYNELIKKYYKIIIFVIIIIFLLFVKKSKINFSDKLLLILASLILILHLFSKILDIYEKFTDVNSFTIKATDNLQTHVDASIKEEEENDIKNKNIGNRTAESITLHKKASILNRSIGRKLVASRALTGSQPVNRNSAIAGYEGKDSINNTGVGKTLEQRKTKRGDTMSHSDEDSSATGDTQNVKEDVTTVTLKDRIKKASKIIYGDIKSDESKEVKNLVKTRKRGTLDEKIIQQLQGRQKTLGKKSSQSQVIVKSDKVTIEEDTEGEAGASEEFDSKKFFTKDNITSSDNDVEDIE